MAGRSYHRRAHGSERERPKEGVPRQMVRVRSTDLGARLSIAGDGRAGRLGSSTEIEWQRYERDDYGRKPTAIILSLARRNMVLDS